jgi:hypothetical protein
MRMDGGKDTVIVLIEENEHLRTSFAETGGSVGIEEHQSFFAEDFETVGADFVEDHGGLEMVFLDGDGCEFGELGVRGFKGFFTLESLASRALRYMSMESLGEFSAR